MRQDPLAVTPLLAGLLFTLATPPELPAQTPGDVATQIITVAGGIAKTDGKDLLIDAGLIAEKNTGLVESSVLRGSLLAGRDNNRWTMGTYGTATHDTYQKQTTNERYALALAGARDLGDRWKLMLIAEYNHIPFAGLESATIVAPTALRVSKLGSSGWLGLLGGIGWATEQFTTDLPGTSFATSVLGGEAGVPLSKSSVLTVRATYFHDLSQATNYVVGGSVQVDAKVVGILGLRLGYSLTYDNEPLAGLQTTNSSLSASIQLQYVREGDKKDGK